MICMEIIYGEDSAATPEDDVCCDWHLVLVKQAIVRGSLLFRTAQEFQLAEQFLNYRCTTKELKS